MQNVTLLCSKDSNYLLAFISLVKWCFKVIQAIFYQFVSVKSEPSSGLATFWHIAHSFGTFIYLCMSCPFITAKFTMEASQSPAVSEQTHD